MEIITDAETKPQILITLRTYFYVSTYQWHKTGLLTKIPMEECLTMEGPQKRSPMFHLLFTTWRSITFAVLEEKYKQPRQLLKVNLCRDKNRPLDYMLH